MENRPVSITIPDSVTSIGDDAFYGCRNLASITIPDSVTSIGDDAFNGCSSLTSVTIPDSVTSIGKYTFYGCSSLTDITIPDSVTSIGNCAFGGCSNLTSVTIPNSVTSIGNSAFSGCSNLTSVTIPNSVTSIDNYAFNSCSSLTSITMPNSVTKIGYNAFNNCKNLSDVYYAGTESEKNSISIGSYNTSLTSAEWHCAEVHVCNFAAFSHNQTEHPHCAVYKCICGQEKASEKTSFVKTCNDCIYHTNGYFSCEVDEEQKVTITKCDPSATGVVSVPATIDGYEVVAIADGAFDGCSKITELVIPETVTAIDDHLEGCTSLNELTLPLALKYAPSLGTPNSINIYADSWSYVFSKESTKWITVNIASTATMIPTKVFSFASQIGTINLASGNTNFKIIDGVLYNYSVTRFYLYPMSSTATSYVMPDTVERTDRGDDYTDVLYYASNLKSITIGASFNFGYYDEFFDSSLGQSAYSKPTELYLLCNYLLLLGDGSSHTTLMPFNPSLEEIKVSPNHKYLTSKNGILCVKDSTYDVKLVYPGAMTGELAFDDNDIIYQYAFLAQQTKDRVYISDKFTENLYLIFSEINANKIAGIANEPNFNELVLHQFYKFLGDNLLGYSTASEYSVSDTNPYFSVDENGILYSKDKTKLIKYPVYSNLEFFELSKDLYVYSNAFYSFTPLSFEYFLGYTPIGSYRKSPYGGESQRILHRPGVF